MIKLELTEEKAKALGDLIDMAVKAGGLNVAKAAVILTDDILQAIKDSKNTEE